MPDAALGGRPRSSSAATLQEAAYELFLEVGYDAASAGEIARRAGVSRSTFWGYLSAKSDLLWFDVDAALGRLDGELADIMQDAAVQGVKTVLDRIRRSVSRVARDFGPGDVPLPFIEVDNMRVAAELRASGFSRLGRLVDSFARLLRASGASPAEARSMAWSEAARVIAAAEEWVAGHPRRPLGDYLANRPCYS